MANYLPQNYELPAVVTGDTFPAWRVTSIKINGVAPSTALDSVRMDFRTTPAAAVASLSLNSTSNGITINNNATWDFTIDEFQLSLDPGTYYWDIETTTGTTVRTYLAGSFKVATGTTR